MQLPASTSILHTEFTTFILFHPLNQSQDQKLKLAIGWLFGAGIVIFSNNFVWQT